MRRPLRLLVVEDSERDRDLLVHELRRGGYEPLHERVETAKEMRDALGRAPWDIVLSDYTMPQFSALEALQVLKESGCDIPFIIVSGSIGEDAAVEALKAGAHDFLAKDRLARLLPAIDREVREARIRRERRDAAALLDSLYETAPIGLAFIDRELRYVRINESLAAINGAPVASHIGRRVSEILPEIGPTFEDKLRRIFETGQPILNVEMSGKTPAAPGQQRHWLVNYYPVRDASGAVLGVGAVVLEITERKRAEQALRAGDARKTAILASAFDGIISMDDRGRIVDFNPAAEKIFGRKAEQVLGKEMARLLIPARLRNQHRRGLARFLETGEGPILGKVVEMPALRSDGMEFPVELAITVVEGIRPPIFTGYIRDISSRKRAEAEREQLLAELAQAVKARDEFLSIASHELKTPLTPLELQLATAVDLVRKNKTAADHPLFQKLESKLDSATRQVERLTVLVKKLLDVTRITSGRLTLARREVDLCDLVLRVVERSREAIKASGSDVTVVAETPVKGIWDPSALESVVSNLLSNAVKYGEGKPIEVSIVSEREVARMAVIDHGMGIAPEEQERIFQRFERAVPAQHYGGVGLGLWIARQVVEAHGGSIRVKSQMGAGSTFTVELPLAFEAKG